MDMSKKLWALAEAASLKRVDRSKGKYGKNVLMFSLFGSMLTIAKAPLNFHHLVPISTKGILRTQTCKFVNNL